ncbi:hypothetical protein MVEN_00371500 [Mycena venus]|uniref:Uncharacterized protein n=1 Tax=Mycena venus TaxID=2733690 RepID=A0A8H7D7E0_9AGAR|nr:hypothetical protein MVEN_00371500 [Mycena venus]
MSAMNRNPSRPPPLDNENGYFPHPTVPQQARPTAREGSRPTMPITQMGLNRQRSGPDQYQSQPTQPVLQRQRSRPQEPYPEQPVLQRQPSRPDQPYQGQPGRPPLQRQPSRPDGQQPLPLQRQPSRPNQDPRLWQPQPSRPDQYYPDPTTPREIAPSQPMAESSYQSLPMQPVAPALMRAPSAPSSTSSASAYDSQSNLTAPIRPYADTMLIRGNSDDELDKTDVFWRRFNASAVQQQLPDSEKSSWLERTQGKRLTHARILWIVGIIFVILAAGGIGIGVYLSFHNSSDATRPGTAGGSEDITSAGAAAATIGGGGGIVGGNAGATTTSFHVTPTNTVAR